MRLGIDASNIRTGGGLTHLLEILRAADPRECGITQVVVWAGQQTLDHLPSRPWLDRRHEAMLDQSLPMRLYWQKTRLPRLAEQSCDCLFIPGGSDSRRFAPFVTVSSNLLPFEKAERRRYGISWMRLKLWLLRFSQVRSFRRADGIIFLTEYARSTVTRIVKRDGWHPVIPFGINKKFYLPPRAQKPLAAYSWENPFRLLYVSKIEPYKHQWTIAEAVARLRSEGLPLMLDLIGGPENAPAWRRLMRTIGKVDPSAEFIHYLGHVPYAELPAYYHRADAFVFASSCENLPNILLEAMASGLPIVCSKSGPMPEILGTAGSYFTPDHPDDLKQALHSLLEDVDLRNRHSSSAYERALLYSWERCARETFSYIAEIGQRTRINLRLCEQLYQTTR